MLLILLTLISKIFCSSNNLILTPFDHRLCFNRMKNMVSRLTVDYKKLSMKIEPGMALSSFTHANALCPVAIIQSSSKLTKRMLGKGREVGYWYLSMKISGEFSSCRNYLKYGEIENSSNESKIIHVKDKIQELNCRSPLPVTVLNLHQNFAIWWNWSKEAMPRLQIDIIPYIEYKGYFEVQQKISICKQTMGFWCGEICIDERMRCDGIYDCAVFSSKQSPSADELNCSRIYNNYTKHGSKKIQNNVDSFWISNIFYILLCIVGFILLFSASKICITNTVLLKRFQSKKQSSTRNSPLCSLSTGESDRESAYDEVQKWSESDSKKDSSFISGDEETQEELLGNSKEFIDSVYNDNVFHPQLVAPKKQIEKAKPHKLPALVQLHSLSSYQLQDCSSVTTMSTNVSLTGAILTQGQNAISEMNSPGSSRTFRKIFNKNLNKTSSYDKILMNQDTDSSTPSRDREIVKLNQAKNSKSNTMSRLESSRRCGSDDDSSFTDYIIV